MRINVYVCTSWVCKSESAISQQDWWELPVNCQVFFTSIRNSHWATGESGDQVGWDGVGMTMVLWACSLSAGWHLVDNITFPHAGTSPPAKPPPTHPPVQPCLLRIHGGSELHRRGLSNQTTHAKANGGRKTAIWEFAVWRLMLCREARRRRAFGVGCVCAVCGIHVCGNLLGGES